VPEHNFYRQLKQRLNLDILYELAREHYGSQPPVDRPVVFFKLCSQSKAVFRGGIRMESFFDTASAEKWLLS
jgi:hypothetical protein